MNRLVLGAGLLSLALFAAFPAGASAKGFFFCWTGERAYPFPYKRPGYRIQHFVNATPDCRQTNRETLDFAPFHGFTAYTSIGAAHLQLRAPHGEAPGAPRTWPLRDSFGHVFALLTQQRIPGSLGDRWTISYPNGLVYGTSAQAGLRLLIQGRGCMTTDRLENQNVMVVLFGGRHGLGPFAFGTQLYPGPVYMGIRGFLPRRALPQRGLANPHGRLRGGSTDRIIDSFSTGCRGESGPRFVAPPPPEPKVHSSLVPLFDWNDRYSGGGAGGNAGSRLANYHGWPDPKQDRPTRPGPVPARTTGRVDIVREVKLMKSTTAVKGGGIVRAIVPAGSHFVELDHFPYRDPNVLCARVAPGRVEAAAVVQWMYVRIVGTRIVGWVPFRTTPQVTRCPAGDAGRPPPR
jgi:hypothetical protein